MIGVVDFLCQRRRTPMVVQSPSILRMTLESQRGIHASRHVRAAAAHVSYYARKHAATRR
jgi:hypothetical protein